MVFSPRETDPDFPNQLKALSTCHVSGEIRILPGEPTQTTLPPQPQKPKVYSEAPTPETASIHFELTGGVVTAGAREVPLDLYVTSNFEFSAFAASVKFPAFFMEIARVDDHTRRAAVRIDNGDGHVGMAQLNTYRRTGLEGERVHLATLYANIKDQAKDIPQLELEFQNFRGYLNWVGIQYQNTVADKLPITAEVQPLLVTNAALKLQRPQMVRRGDANNDGQFDTTDALLVLNYLFLGGAPPACPGAADFDMSGELDISDPIAFLSSVYLGRPPIDTLEPAEVPCR
ncbi:MAG: hypothetical protein HY717_05845 [Planctomycetes bacterium]|nr:hypothetical protein [Planctomycetota bacterium]